MACEINSGDELVATEMIFAGVLTELTPEEAVALLSALVFQVQFCACPRDGILGNIVASDFMETMSFDLAGLLLEASLAKTVRKDAAQDAARLWVAKNKFTVSMESSGYYFSPLSSDIAQHTQAAPVCQQKDSLGTCELTS